MNSVTLFSTVLILIGATVMSAGIYRFRPLVRMLARVTMDEYRNLRWLLITRITLMIFFFFGYLGMAYVTVRHIELVNDFFVGVIFLFGNIFVYPGMRPNPSS